MNVIELRKVGKTFTDRDEPTIALHDVDLAIEPGEFVAIIGPSGSGKSTLMNVLGLLDIPSSGEYLLDGQVVSKLRDRKLARLRRDKIGFVFQSFNLLPRLSVLGNVELPMIYAGIRSRKRRKRALELLKLVHLENRAGYKPRQISGGQTQRVAIARALANEPSLVLADEPTGNLDSKASADVIDELRRLNRETGATIVIVTHNPDIAALTDRTVTVRDGAVVSDQHNPGTRRQPAPLQAGKMVGEQNWPEQPDVAQERAAGEEANPRPSARRASSHSHPTASSGVGSNVIDLRDRKVDGQ